MNYLFEDKSVEELKKMRDDIDAKIRARIKFLESDQYPGFHDLDGFSLSFKMKRHKDPEGAPSMYVYGEKDGKELYETHLSYDIMSLFNSTKEILDYLIHSNIIMSFLNKENKGE